MNAIDLKLDFFFFIDAKKQILTLTRALILFPCVTNSCHCSPETHGPQCTSKYDDCEAGSQALCVHGICEDLVRVQAGEVGSFRNMTPWRESASLESHPL